MLRLLLLLQAATGRIDGTVTTDAGAPIAGATVTIAALDRRAESDRDGRFTFRQLRAGILDLSVTAPGFQPASLRVEVSADRTVRIEIGLMPRLPRGDPAGTSPVPQARPQELPPLEVVARTRSGATSPISAPGDLSDALVTGFTRLTREEIKAVPPTFEPDVLRALQATAGVGAANDINAHPAIRGSAPEHTLFLLDGAPVLGPYHMFGLFGAFNPDAVDDAQILRGSLPARVGGALGSVVSLRSARPRGFRVTGGATVLASRIAASGPVGGAGSWLVAGRRTNLGFGASGPFDIEMPYWFWDLQSTFRVAPGPDQEIIVTGYASGDKFVEDLFFVDQGSAPLFSTWSNRVVSAAWRLTRPRGWSASVGIWRSAYRSMLALGDTAFRADSAATNGTTSLAGASVALGRPLGRGAFRLDLGLTSNRAALKGDSVAPGYLDDHVDRRLVELSASAELEQRIGPVTVAPGVRATHWSVGSRWTVEPRLTARWESARGLRVTASATRTEQALFALRDDRLPILGVPFWILPDSLEPRAGATSFELAAAGSVAPGWVAEVSLFHRRLSGLARWRPSGIRDLSELGFDQGTVSGLELSLARKIGKVTGWVTYTPLISTVRDGTGGSYRALWHRGHALTAVAELKLGGWGHISHRFALSTGQPFWVEQGTFSGSEFDPFTGTARPRTDADFPIWSSTQGQLPVYLRADLTASATWRIGGVRLSPFAGLINLGGRRNVTGYRAQPGGLAGTIEYLPRRQLPRVPVLGVDFSIGGEGRR
jgi:hypothetical protein